MQDIMQSCLHTELFQSMERTVQRKHVLNKFADLVTQQTVCTLSNNKDV